MPFVLNPINYFSRLFIAPGTAFRSDITVIPGVTSPTTITELFIYAGAPAPITWAVDYLQASSALLVLGAVLIFWALMRARVSYPIEADYWKRFLLLILILAIWSFVASPRGMYKYYTELLVPLCIIYFCSQASGLKSRIDAYSVAIIPTVFLTLAVLIPIRPYYLLCLVLLVVVLSLFALGRQGIKEVSRLLGQLVQRNRLRNSGDLPSISASHDRS
jgi:hypothetical protein